MLIQKNLYSQAVTFLERNVYEQQDFLFLDPNLAARADSHSGGEILNLIYQYFHYICKCTNYGIYRKIEVRITSHVIYEY